MEETFDWSKKVHIKESITCKFLENVVTLVVLQKVIKRENSLQEN